jgi:hypothetical protein
MLAAIDAYFSASDGTEAEVAENLLLDVRDEINKQKYVPETNFGNMAEPKIGCVNHDCDQCKAVQEPLSELEKDAANLLFALHDAWPYVHGHCTIESKKKAIQALMVKHGDFADLQPTAPQPVPVKTYHDGKPWPVAPKPWVGLTDEEMEKLSVENGKATFLNDDEETDILWFDGDCFALLKAAEAKLKEKNHG